MQSSPPDNQRFLVLCFAVSLVLHLFAAWKSAGYYHMDEHFQVYEYAAYKLGKAPASDMPWEFHARIRPWLQPAILVGLAHGLSAIGIETPAGWALVYRLLSAILAWTGLLLLARVARDWIASERGYRLAVVALSSVWFLPYLGSRVSSEGWSRTLLTLALVLAVSGTRAPARRYRAMVFLGAGLLCGLAFQFRYQVGIAAAALFLWTIVETRRVEAFVLGTLGILATFPLGMAIDAWGYGENVFPAWNYFRVNLIENKAAEWGIQAPWFYLTSTLLDAVPPVSLLLVGGTLAGWYFYPRHALTFVTAAFVIVHSAIGHKELRFLFPVVNFALLLSAMALDRLLAVRFSLAHSRGARLAVIGLFALNAIPLLVSIAKPANVRVAFYSHLPKLRGTGPLYTDEDPYRWGKLAFNFYRTEGLEIRPLARGAGSTEHPDGTWFVVGKNFALPERTPPALRAACSLSFSTVPEWLTGYNVNDWLSRTPVWNVFRCENHAKAESTHSHP